MKKEFNLSEKIDDKQFECENCGEKYCTYEEVYFKLKDVKKFIKKLKSDIEQEFEEGNITIKQEDKFNEIIDKLAGEKLI